MSLFSALGSSAFGNFGYGMGGIGTLASAYMMYSGARSDRRRYRRERIAAQMEREQARKYDTPLEQSRRLREAGFTPNHLSAGAYGPIVTNTSGDVSPVGNPGLDIIERFGNMYNVFRQIRQSEIDNALKVKQIDNADAHNKFNQQLKLKEIDLRQRELIEKTTSGLRKQKLLEEQHKEMLKLKTDMFNETKKYHEDIIGIAKRNSYNNTLSSIINGLGKAMLKNVGLDMDIATNMKNFIHNR